MSKDDHQEVGVNKTETKITPQQKADIVDYIQFHGAKIDNPDQDSRWLDIDYVNSHSGEYAKQADALAEVIDTWGPMVGLVVPQIEEMVGQKGNLIDKMLDREARSRTGSEAQGVNWAREFLKAEKTLPEELPNHAPWKLIREMLENAVDIVVDGPEEEYRKQSNEALVLRVTGKDMPEGEDLTAEVAALVEGKLRQLADQGDQRLQLFLREESNKAGTNGERKIVEYAGRLLMGGNPMDVPKGVEKNVTAVVTRAVETIFPKVES